MPKPATLPDQRLAVARVEAFVQGGLSLVKACHRAGVSRANYYRWKTDSEPGTENREPGTPKRQRGRPTLVDLTEAEIRRLRYWRLIRDSVPLALQEFLRDDLCRPEVAELVRGIWQKALARHKRPSWPLSIRRALQVTEAERAIFRGEKAYRETEVYERRGDFIRLEDGEEWPNQPGYIYSSDDESENQPFRFRDPVTGDREMLGRQSLKTLDNYSHKWLGFTHIGRPRDAYRVEDIADHFADIVRLHGLPLMWRVEQGVWDNKWLFGIKCDNGKTWGSMEELFHIRQKHSSKGKADIEGAFNFSQDLRAHGLDGGVTSIGRKRGEFEKATKEYLRAQKGDEVDLRKFWSIHESAEAVAIGLARDNATPKQRHALKNKFITPDEAFGTPVKREVPTDKWWLFCPVKRQATVKQGAIDVMAPHYPVSFRFRVNGSEGMNGLHLDHGHKVLIAFHPNQPELGCHIFNNDDSATNREGFGWAELIGMAEWLPDRPQEDLSGSGDFSARKRERAGIRREFRGMLEGTGRMTRKSHAQDALGNTLRAASGLPATAAPAPRQTRAGMLLPSDLDVQRAASLPTADRATDALATTEDRLRNGAAILL